MISDKKIRGGEPVISRTGIRVMDIAVRYEVMGMSPDEIIAALPHLNLSQIHDALSYYYENKDIIDAGWKDSLKKMDELKKAPSVLEKKLGKIKNLY
ncbi:MAG: DUF433 domain-containing protein [Candidatus Schekmanbacteria bacterium]|nr:DUF433 domain-containing protein [Candidatus Schekmanbacteria bacterium]